MEYNPFPDLGWLWKWFNTRTLTSSYGSETVSLNRAVEALICAEISRFNKCKFR